MRNSSFACQPQLENTSTYFALLYSNSMCKQSSMPTSILIVVLISGVCGHYVRQNSRHHNNPTYQPNQQTSCVDWTRKQQYNRAHLLKVLDPEILLLGNVGAVVAPDSGSHKVPDGGGCETLLCAVRCKHLPRTDTAHSHHCTFHRA